MARSGRLLSLNVARASAVTINGREVMTAIGKRAVEGARAVRHARHRGRRAGRPLGARRPGQGGLRLPERALRVLADGARAGRRRAVGRAAAAGRAGREPHRSPASSRASSSSATCCAFPDCALAVSEPRFPCFKFNAAMGFAHAAKLMVQSAWCGWYLAVREPGTIAAGESFDDRPRAARGRHQRAVPRPHGRPSPATRSRCSPTATPFTPATTPTCSSTWC